MITLGSPCKRHEVLVRVGMTRIAKQEDLPRVGMTRIGKQEVMARVGRTRIVMHGRLPRGKSALDRELAIILVGLGVWLDIDSKRAGISKNDPGYIIGLTRHSIRVQYPGLEINGPLRGSGFELGVIEVSRSGVMLNSATKWPGPEP
ncbi:hypothetical protein LWI29_011153 [Acer saccharum]|uniref:Uncharacterized protein n=1 Tax=Acer saccharum TaxID=4024 RepID=A0AA39TNB2_ACESA|nr:hypothetical protein LWI29_011153 [Acer saccharum]